MNQPCGTTHTGVPWTVGDGLWRCGNCGQRLDSPYLDLPYPWTLTSDTPAVYYYWLTPQPVTGQG